MKNQTQILKQTQPTDILGRPLATKDEIARREQLVPIYLRRGTVESLAAIMRKAHSINSDHADLNNLVGEMVWQWEEQMKNDRPLTGEEVFAQFQNYKPVRLGRDSDGLVQMAQNMTLMWPELAEENGLKIE